LECGRPLPLSHPRSHPKRQRTGALQNLAVVRTVHGRANQELVELKSQYPAAPLRSWVVAVLLSVFAFLVSGRAAAPEPFSQTHKPVLHGRHWVAITGKPLGAVAGARIFERGGNAVDAACAMLAAVCTLYDDVSWGGETQALIYDPRAKKGVRINALGVAPTGDTPEVFKGEEPKIPAGRRSARRANPGQPGRVDDHAGRVRDDVAQRRPRAGDAIGQRLSHRSRTRSEDQQ